jgi:hypothetical protein
MRQEQLRIAVVIPCAGEARFVEAAGQRLARLHDLVFAIFRAMIRRIPAS